MAPTSKLEATPAIIAPEDLLTVDELAARLKVPKSWVFEQTRERSRDPKKNPNPLPCIYLSPKVVRFRWTSVSQWLQNKADTD
jgi:hypothetical protein